MLWVVGADPAFVTGTSERRWYHSMGGAVLVVTLFAFVGAAITLNFRYPDSDQWVTWVIGGLVWAVAVFVIDRGITSYVERYPSAWRKFTTIITRLLLALFAAVAVSEALVLNLLDNEIQQQLVLDDIASARTRLERAQAAEQPELNRIDAEVARLTTAVDNAKRDVDAAQLKLTCETAGGRSPGCEGVATTGRPNRGPVVRDILEPALANAKGVYDKAVADYNAYVLDPSPVTLSATDLEACEIAAGTPLSRLDQERCASAARVAVATAVSDDELTDVVLNRIIASFNIGEPGSPQRAATHIVHAVLFGLFLFIDLIPLITKFFRGTTKHDEQVIAASTANPPVPRFDDRRLRPGYWADGEIGKDAMVAARRSAKDFYGRLFAGQVEQHLQAYFGGPPPRRTETAGPAPAVQVTDRLAEPEVTMPPGPIRDNLDDGSEQPPGPHVATLGVGAELGGRYRLQRPLGVPGPNYAIYVVRDLRATNATSDEYAAKIALNPSRSGFAYKGLEKEVRAGQVIRHNNTMPALSDVLEDPRFRIAFRLMPYYPLGDLSRWIERNPARTVAEWLEIGNQILRGIEAAHRREITHWDLKPENVLMESVGSSNVRPVIGDWGNGKSLFRFEGPVTQDMRGTYDYCAPEQLSSTPAEDRRCYASDLYSWAAVMFAFAAGVSPHRVAAQRDGIDVGNFNAYAVFLNSAPVMPRLAGQTPPALSAMLHRWLSPQPERRPLEQRPGLTIAELRQWQVAESARRELRDASRVLTREQLDAPVTSLVTVSPYGHPGSDASTAPS